jgi:hypothetical protein
MNCEQLNKKYEETIEKITNPFKKSREKTQKISTKSNKIFTSTFNDIFDISNNIKISTTKKDIAFVAKIKTIQENLINKTIKENELLNKTICDYTLNIINEKLKSPTIQYPVILFIVFLIYPFLRIIFFILSFISLVLFEISFLSKIYTTKKENIEVENIE